MAHTLCAAAVAVADDGIAVAFVRNEPCSEAHIFGVAVRDALGIFLEPYCCRTGFFIVRQRVFVRRAAAQGIV